jgi:diadenosine tetraphosphate (Ap4A) HIT family hydrolase
MSQTPCMYCGEKPKVLELMIPICELEVTKLYLFRNQAHPGRCVIATKAHVNEFCDLSQADAEAFARDMRRVSMAIRKVFAPDKINLGMYFDLGRHLHCHIVPKYEGGVDWGGTFTMNPQPAVTLSDEAYQQRIDQIKAAL